MAASLIRVGTWAIIACVSFAGVLDLIAGLVASSERSTQGAIVLLGLAAVLIYGITRR